MATTLPLTYNLTVYRGTTFAKAFRWKPDGTSNQDFTGWSAVLYVRSPGYAALKSFTTMDNSLALNSNGQLIVSLTKVQTALLEPGVYSYNVDLGDPSGATTRFLTGRFVVKRDAGPA